MRVFIEDLIDAMGWTSEGAYLNVETGNTIVITDDLECAMRNFEDLPEGASDEEAYEAFGWGWEDPEFLSFLRDEGRFLRLPDSYDINERRIMRNFAWSLDNAEHGDALLDALHRRKPYRQFKNEVHNLGIAQQWYDFKDARLMEIAREWCLENDVEYTFRNPEKALVRRKFAKEQLAGMQDAEAACGNIIFSHGIFEHDWTALADDIRRNWEGELEEVEIDVDLWSMHHNVDPDREDAAERPEGMPMVLEISPDRRLVAPDDPHALFLCCVIADGNRWLSWAKHAGKERVSALLVPMEVHNKHICRHRKEYAEYWNGKVDDLIEYAGKAKR